MHYIRRAEHTDTETGQTLQFTVHTGVQRDPSAQPRTQLLNTANLSGGHSGRRAVEHNRIQNLFGGGELQSY